MANNHHALVFWAPDQQNAKISITIGAKTAVLHQIMSNANTQLTAQGGVVNVNAQDEVQVLEW
jgi:hypothetical protein